jgi:hypothetical protein
VGYQAGRSYGIGFQNKNADNSVYIGYNAFAQADNQTNQIVVGASALGNGSNTATWGNTLMTAHYFAGSINATTATFSTIGTGTATSLLGVTSAGLLTTANTLNVITGTGTRTSNYVARFNGSSNTISNSLIYDDGTNVGIGTTSPTLPLHVVNNAASATMVVQNLNIGGYSSVRCLDSVGTMKTSVGYGNASSGFPNQGYFIAYDATTSLTFLTNYTERMRLTPEGNFGIGSTAPSALLTLNAGASGGDYTKGLQISCNGDNSSGGVRIWHTDAGSTAEYFDSMYDLAASSINFRTRVLGTPVNAMTILGSGNVGIGTPTPYGKLDVKVGTSAQDKYWYDATSGLISLTTSLGRPGAGLGSFNSVGNTYDSDLIFYNMYYAGGADYQWKERMRIRSDGNVGIGTPTPAYLLDVSGTGRFTSTVTATNFILSSDSRVKENILPYTSNILDIEYKSFNLKSDPTISRVGVIAQEIEKDHPELVYTNAEGMKSVAYIDLLIKEIVSLKNRVKQLEGGQVWQ